MPSRLRDPKVVLGLNGSDPNIHSLTSAIARMSMPIIMKRTIVRSDAELVLITAARIITPRLLRDCSVL